MGLSGFGLNMSNLSFRYSGAAADSSKLEWDVLTDGAATPTALPIAAEFIVDNSTDTVTWATLDYAVAGSLTLTIDNFVYVSGDFSLEISSGVTINDAVSAVGPITIASILKFSVSGVD